MYHQLQYMDKWGDVEQERHNNRVGVQPKIEFRNDKFTKRR